MYIDFKVTAWERVHIDEDSDVDTQELRKKLQTGEIQTSNQLYDHVDDSLLDYEILTETVEYMTVEENEGASTMEAYEDNGDLTYKNGNP